MSVSINPIDGARGRLLAVLGVSFGVWVTIGNVIGVGILRSPGVVAGHLHTFWPFLAVWIAGGLYALMGANAIAELGTMIPRSGGHYVFVRRGLGEIAGFVTGWSDWIAICATAALVAIVVGEYMVALFPEARTHHVVALGVVAGFTLIQWAGIRVAGVVQIVASVVKVLALLLFIAICFWLGSRSPAAPTVVTTENEGSMLLACVLALQVVIVTNDGWAAAVYFSEDVRNPGRNLPRMLLMSVVLITAIYLVVNLGLLAVVSLPTLAGSHFATSVVAERLFGSAGYVVVRALIVLMLLSAVSAKVLMAPRVLFAMAKDGLFWRGANEVSGRGTPDIALLISSTLAALFIVTGTFESVVTTLAFFLVANYILSLIALFVLRRNEPREPRPWRAWGHPWTTGMALLVSLAILGGMVVVDPRNALQAIAMLLVSVPVCLLVKHRRRRSAAVSGHEPEP